MQSAALVTPAGVAYNHLLLITSGTIWDFFA